MKLSTRLPASEAASVLAGDTLRVIRSTVAYSDPDGLYDVTWEVVKVPVNERPPETELSRLSWLVTPPNRFARLRRRLGL